MNSVTNFEIVVDCKRTKFPSNWLNEITSYENYTIRRSGIYQQGGTLPLNSELWTDDEYNIQTDIPLSKLPQRKRGDRLYHDRFNLHR